jgi:hypothetical protein
MKDLEHGPDPLGGPMCRHAECPRRHPCPAYMSAARDRFATANAERDAYWAEVLAEKSVPSPRRAPRSSEGTV